VVVFVGMWALTSSHRVLPNERGCDFVRSTQPRWNCRATFMQQRIEREGLAKAIPQIEQQTRERRLFMADCHQTAHIVGRRLVSEKLFKVKDLPGTLGACTAGLLHGMTEQTMRGDQWTAAQARDSICAARSGIAAGYIDCTHGIGHALIRTGAGTKPASCDTISDRIGRMNCRSGVYMELASTTSPTRWAQRCSSVPKLDRYSCSFYTAARISLENKMPIDAVIDRCLDLSSDRVSQAGCIGGTGVLAGTAKQAKPCMKLDEFLRAVCTAANIGEKSDEAPDDAWKQCISGGLDIDGCALAAGKLVSRTNPVSAHASTLLAQCHRIVGAAHYSSCATGALGCTANANLADIRPECAAITDRGPWGPLWLDELDASDAATLLRAARTGSRDRGADGG
jgi:hypothetical protein